jgi:CheY-like chemotaxis protein
MNTDSSKNVWDVLLVDDDPFTRQLFKTALKHTKLHLISASSYATALALLAELTPHLVIVDIMLPEGRDGYSLLKVLRSDYKLTCPFVATTAYYNDDTHARFRSEGFAGYLLKPLDVEGIADYLTQLVQSASPE